MCERSFWVTGSLGMVKELCAPREPLLFRPSLACSACGPSPPQAWAGFFSLIVLCFLPPQDCCQALPFPPPFSFPFRELDIQGWGSR